MDFFEEIQTKISFLNEQKNRELARLLFGRVERKVLELTETRVLSQKQRRFLAFDLCYLFLKHRSWYQAPIFSDLVLDHLSREFSIPGKIATQIVNEGIELLSNYLKVKSFESPQKYNREFLFELFVTTLHASSEAELRYDIGFGDNLIKLFRSALELESDSQTHYVFSNELTGEIYAIMDELTQQSKHTPWALDAYKIRLYFRRASLDRLPTKEECIQFFQLLCFIGWKAISSDELIEAFKEEGDSRNIREEIRLLNEAKLLIEQPRRKKEFLSLSYEGMSVVASFLAEQVLESGQFNIEDLSKLPALLQEKLAEHPSLHEDKHQETFKKILKNLAPEALLPLTKGFKNSPGRQAILEVLSQLLHTSQNAWYRAKALDSLAYLIESNETEEAKLLDEVSLADPSPMVRRQARMLKEQLGANRQTQQQ